MANSGTPCSTLKDCWELWTRQDAVEHGDTDGVGVGRRTIRVVRVHRRSSPHEADVSGHDGRRRALRKAGPVHDVYLQPRMARDHGGAASRSARKRPAGHRST
eukprot:9478834-Pyramimonas_sp.AAC.2